MSGFPLGDVFIPQPSFAIVAEEILFKIESLNFFNELLHLH